MNTTLHFGSLITEITPNGEGNGEVDVEVIPYTLSTNSTSATQEERLKETSTSTSLSTNEANDSDTLQDDTKNESSKQRRSRLFFWKKKSQIKDLSAKEHESMINNSGEDMSGGSESRTYSMKSGNEQGSNMLLSQETANGLNNSETRSNKERKQPSFRSLSRMFGSKQNKKNRSRDLQSKINISIQSKDMDNRDDIDIQPENLIFQSLSNGSVDVYEKHREIKEDGMMDLENDKKCLMKSELVKPLLDEEDPTSSTTPTTEILSTEDESYCLTPVSSSDHPVTFILNVPQVSNNENKPAEMEVPNILDCEETLEMAQQWKAARRQYSEHLRNMNSVDDHSSVQNEDCVQEMTKSTGEIFNDAYEACRFAMQYQEPYPTIRRNSTKTTKVMSNRLEDESIGSFAYFNSGIPALSSYSDIFTTEKEVDVSALSLDKSFTCKEQG